MKNCIVTGGTSGLGQKIAEGLARAGHRVIITSRSLARAEEAARRMRRDSGNDNIEPRQLNLASFDSIRSFARSFADQGTPLHILVNNAGIFSARGTTQEGFELIFGTNYVGPFLLTDLLMPALKAAGRAKILNVASDAAYKAPTLDWDAFIRRTGLNTLKAYAGSKLALVMWTAELSRLNETGDTGVRAKAFHPGFVQSNISIVHRIATALRQGIPAETAAKPGLAWLLSEGTGTDNLDGLFIGPNGANLPLPDPANDRALAEALSTRSRQWIGFGTDDLTATPQYDPVDGVFGPYKVTVPDGEVARISQDVRENVLPRAPIRSIAKTALRLLKDRQPGSLAVLLVQWIYRDHHMERHLDVPSIWNLCQDPGILEALKPHLGEDLVLWRSEIWVNKPAQRRVFVWHHDIYPKLVAGTGRGLNVYIALTDVHENNGFEYLPASAVREATPPTKMTDLFSGNHFFGVPPEMAQQARPISLRAGEFILFTNDLIHRSVLNSSGKVRVALTLRVLQPTLTARAGYSPIHRPVRLSGKTS